MLDLGWSELFVIAVVAIIVVGPRELPGMLRNVGKFVGQMRRMAGEFQRQFNDALKDAELDEVKKDIESVRNAASKATAAGVAASVNPMKAAADSIKDAVDKPDTNQDIGSETETETGATEETGSASEAKTDTAAAPLKPATTPSAATNATDKAADRPPADDIADPARKAAS